MKLGNLTELLASVLFADCLRIFPDLSAFCRVKSFIFFVLNGLVLTLDRHIVSSAAIRPFKSCRNTEKAGVCRSIVQTGNAQVSRNQFALWMPTARETPLRGDKRGFKHRHQDSSCGRPGNPCIYFIDTSLATLIAATKVGLWLSRPSCPLWLKGFWWLVLLSPVPCNLPPKFQADNLDRCDQGWCLVWPSFVSFVVERVLWVDFTITCPL